MDQHHHHVSGFFATRAEALEARSALVTLGLPRDQLRIYESDAPVPGQAPKGDSNAVLKDVLVDGAIGTAVGTGLGALAEVALVAANVSVFIASPLLAPMVMMGWGASIGALIGTAVGATASDKAIAPGSEEWLSALSKRLAEAA